jgi:hypothetical protein
MKKQSLEDFLKGKGITKNQLNYMIDNKQKTNPIKRKDIRLPFDYERNKFLVISDLHIGHKNFREDILDDAIKYSKHEGCEFVLIPGDILEGMSGREGQIYELEHIGATKQMDYAVEQLSKFDIPIYGMTATNSHDGWYSCKGNMGLEVGPELERRVKNFKFLGYDEVDLEFGKGIKARMVHPGGGTCFDNETEILTENGWKLFKDLNKEEKVATLNSKTNFFEWQLPTQYTDEEYEGEMLNFITRNIDMMVTPNHRLLVRRYNTSIDYNRKENLEYPTKSHRKLTKEWISKTAEELRNCKRQQWQMKRGDVNWKGELIEFIKIPFREHKKFGNTPIKHLGKLNIEDIAELIAWYVTEGHICKKKKQLNICQSQRVNPENHSNIINLFNRIRIKPHISGKDNKDIVVCSVELCEWLISQCGIGSKNKFLPKWLKNQPVEILEIVLNTMVEGDGWINNKGFGYKSISKRLREDFSEVALKLGYAVTEHKDSVSISSIQVYPTINSKPNILNYKGRIYCVSVPNDNILVRRNGRAIWSKNSYAISYKLQKYINSISGGQKPNLLFEGHYHKALYMFYRNIHGFESGTLQEQTVFMRKLQTPAMLGYWIIDVQGKDGNVSKIKPEFIPYFE